MYDREVPLIDIKRLLFAGGIVWALGLVQYLFSATGLESAILSSLKDASPSEIWSSIDFIYGIIQFAIMLLAPYFGVLYYFQNRTTNFVYGVILGMFFVIFSIISYAIWNSIVSHVSPDIGRSFSIFEISLLLIASGVFAETFQRCGMLQK